MRKKTQILQEILGACRHSRDELLFYCPFCKHHKKKLSINLDKSVFKCWVCDTKGGLSYLVRRFGGLEDRHDWEILNQEVDMSLTQSIFEENKKENKHIVPLPAGYVCLAKKGLLYGAKEPLAYLMMRGISSQDILYYKIGYCGSGEYKRRIIIPSFDEDGDCNFFIARSYGKDWLKYKNPRSSKDVIFNDILIDWEEPITLVEGAFDSLKIENSIPLLGSTLRENTKLFKKLVLKQKRIYIGLDKDALIKSLNIVLSMMQHGLEVFKLDTSQIEDIGAISRFEAKNLKDSAVKMNTENILNTYWRE